ncbi:hypothetical protein BV898_12403 [Hypsibius exemplaris]|uniref:Uncharacterized protein n=1 Tax=Hypsibius exemplaris TaxID=2072580 RepID=A0A1W0WDU7_HYPEX|nr:hypothetical protein BV898_12403 [Hypsibius exemplaris]
MGSAYLEINDEIPVDQQAASPAHFWPYYRQLRPSPPLYDRSGRLTVKHRAHVTADEEDPSYNATFDQARFVYPIQKTVAQPTRLPGTSSMRTGKDPNPTATTGGPTVALPVKSDGVAGQMDARKADEALERLLIKESRAKLQGLEDPTKFETAVNEQGLILTPTKTNKYQKPQVHKHHLWTHVNELQHRSVAISKARVRFLEVAMKHRQKMKEYELNVTRSNKDSAARYKAVCAGRDATLQQSIRNARAICIQKAEEQLKEMRQFARKQHAEDSAAKHTVTTKTPFQLAVEALP